MSFNKYGLQKKKGLSRIPLKLTRIVLILIPVLEMPPTQPKTLDWAEAST